MKFHVYHHYDPAYERRLEHEITALSKTLEEAMALLDELTANVVNITKQDDAIIALLANVKAKLDEALAQPAVDTAALQALSDTLGAEAAKVSEAVLANTPTA